VVVRSLRLLRRLGLSFVLPAIVAVALSLFFALASQLAEP
jgi:hypothetical protein